MSDDIQTQIAKFICTEVMDDDWSLGRKLYFGFARQILEIVGTNQTHTKEALKLALDFIDDVNGARNVGTREKIADALGEAS